MHYVFRQSIPAKDMVEKPGCKAIRLDTWEGNKPAARLYERMKFRLAGTTHMLLQGVISEQQIFFERKVHFVY